MHIKDLHKSIGKGEYSMSFVDSSGAIVYIAKCVLTSFHSAGRTINIKLVDSDQCRKVIRWTIIKINNQPLYL